MKVIAGLLFSLILFIAACGSSSDEPHGWVDEDVTFTADGLTIHGTYRHRALAGHQDRRRC